MHGLIRLYWTLNTWQALHCCCAAGLHPGSICNHKEKQLLATTLECHTRLANLAPHEQKLMQMSNSMQAELIRGGLHAQMTGATQKHAFSHPESKISLVAQAE